MSNTHVWVPVTLMAETDLAWLVDFEGDEDVWVPKSQIEDFSDGPVIVGAEIEIEIPEWFAIKEGMV